MTETTLGHEVLLETTAIADATHEVPPERWYTVSTVSSMAEYDQLRPIVGISSEDESCECSLEDSIAISRVLAETTLADEHTHVARLYMAPFLDKSPDELTEEEERAKNDQWLAVIEDGGWPVPGTYRDQGFAGDSLLDAAGLRYSLHDAKEKHRLFFALAPDEMQRELTEAAKWGRLDRESGNDQLGSLQKGFLLDSPENDMVELPATTINSGPFSWHDYSNLNAIDVIDGVSDGDDFLRLMNRLVGLDSAEARDTYMAHYCALAIELESKVDDVEFVESILREKVPEDIASPDEWVANELGRAEEIWFLRRGYAKIASFNTRHRERRNMTKDEMAEGGDKYMSGILRVAHRLAKDDMQPMAA